MCMREREGERGKKDGWAGKRKEGGRESDKRKERWRKEGKRTRSDTILVYHRMTSD